MSTGNRENNVAEVAQTQKQAETGLQSIFITSATAAAWLGLNRVIMKGTISYIQMCKMGLGLCVDGRLFQAKDLPLQMVPLPT